MNEALAGLIGAGIGCLITLIFTYMNNNKDYKLKLLYYDVNAAEEGKPINIIKLKSYIEKVETFYEDLSKSLRNEIAI